jgi:cholesterol transport system auxiliary component
VRPVVVALAVATFALLGACAGSAPSQRYFVLSAAPEPTAVAHAPARASESILLVAPVTTSPFYDTREIAYSRAPGTRAYYRFSSWTEPPALAVQTSLLDALRRSGAFRDVVSSAAGVRGALVLRVDLDEAYHDAATAPGTARISISAEIADPARRALLGRRTFSAAVPTATPDADGAVEGMRQALGRVLADLADWVREIRPA